MHIACMQGAVFSFIYISSEYYCASFLVCQYQLIQFLKGLDEAIDPSVVNQHGSLLHSNYFKLSFHEAACPVYGSYYYSYSQIPE